MVALLVQALRHEVDGQHDQAVGLRAQALDQAPTSSGVMGRTAVPVDSRRRSRLGPILEVVINGRRYGWLPFMHPSKLRIEPVVDLRDLIWAPAQIQFTNGGEAVTLLPARYPTTQRRCRRRLADGAQDRVAARWGSAVRPGQRCHRTDADEVGLRRSGTDVQPRR